MMRNSNRVEARKVAVGQDEFKQDEQDQEQAVTVRAETSLAPLERLTKPSC
jgi:hypothetical protein